MIPGVNLIPTEVQHEYRLRLRRRAWSRVVTVYCTALIVGCAGWLLFCVETPAQLAGQIQREEHESEAHQAELANLRAKLAEQRAGMKLSEALAVRPDWSNLLAIVARTCRNDVVLRSCDVSAASEIPAADIKSAATDASRAVLRVEGIGLNQPAVSRFALTLEQIGIFESIDPSSTRETFEGSDVVGFRLNCWLKTSSRPAARRAAEAVRVENDTTRVIR